MKFPDKKSPLFNLFWLLLFFLFFGIPFKKFELFSIKIEGTEEGISLIFLLFSYFKKLFFENHGVAAIFMSIFLLLLSIVSLFVISFLILNIFEKTSFNKFSFLPFFKKIDNLLKKIFDAKTIHIFLFLFLISVIPRLVYINNGLLHHDSVQTAIATEKTLETGRLHEIVGYRYGFILITAIAYLIPHFIFGVQSSEFTVTLVTIIFASLSAPMLYLFAKELLNNRHIAISSSLVFAFIPIYLSATTYAKDHALSVFLVLFSAYFLIKSIKTDLTAHKLLFSISLGFSLFVRVSDVIAALPLFLLIYIFPEKFLDKEEIKLKPLNAKNLLIILTPLLFMLTLFFIFQGSSIPSGLSGNRFLDFNWALLSNISIALFLFMPSLALFLVAYGLFEFLKGKKYIAFLLLAWFFSTFIFYSSFGTSKLRFFAVLLIPMSIFMGMTLNVLREKSGIVYTLALITVLGLMFLLVQPSLAYRHNYSSEKESALYIAGITENNSLVFDAGDSGVFYGYYTDRGIISCLFADKQQEFDEKIKLINDALGHNIPVYMSSQCFSLAKGEDTQFPKLWKVLSENYEWAEVGKVIKESPESVVYIYLKEYTIYKLRKK